MNRRLLWPAQLLQLGERFGQPLGVGIESGVRNLDGLPARELLQAVGQVRGLRHRGAVDEHGNDRNAALERRLDLDANEIVGILESAAVLTRRRPKPNASR